MEAGNERKTKSEQSSAYKLDLSEISDRLGAPKQEDHDDAPEDMVNEKTPLLRSGAPGTQQPQPKSRLWQIPKRVAHAILYGATVVFSTLSAPGRYVIACFYDNEGHFSAILPLKNFKSLLSRRKRKSTAQAVGLNNAPESDASEEKPRPKPQHRASSKKPRSPSTDGNGSTASAVTSEDEKSEDSPARHTRSKTQALNQQAEEIAPHRKSGRIKLLPNDEALRKRKIALPLLNKRHLKTNPLPPISRSTTTTRAPTTTLLHSLLLPETPRKTLIIDLDETLIHSMAKGGRMSTGHMVEVRLGGNYSSSHSSGVALGPGVPILYYVHERPGCHEFLRKMAKWYNLIVFTASVQEYADPVVDWLERERKYFSGRYYRQHCTFRNGAYIKDLAQVEPDLSKVMILDNSPMSYIFHEDNAIPIEGWISDPTDHELLHLVPLLEGLQYVTDVRALLALRQGQAQQA
ncbi:Nuclear envelope morphology protein 1 [Friedmanniomyces endolithicus]|nr:Nuclear envelope morphology protein 1 [Friedmanniomyces endolithicus]